MRILYISQYYPPEAGATQARALEMTLYLARCGHKVTVLCNLPNHPSGRTHPAFRGKWRTIESWQGMTIIRTWVYARPRKNLAVRAGFYLSFFCTSLLAAMKLDGPFDAVYATSPPPLAGLVGLLLARCYHCKYIYEVRDLWLEMAQELAMVRRRLFIRTGEKFDHLLYRRADALVAVTQGIYDRLAKKGYENKLHLIRNGANPEEFYDRGDGVKSALGYNGCFVVLYAGLLGLAQGIEQVCNLAERFKEEPSVQFLLIGEGPLRTKIEASMRERKLPNVRFLGEVPRERMADYISMADCCLVPLKKRPLFLGAVPTKMFDYMACGCPVILSVDGEARDLLKESGAGIYTEPENLDAMAEAIRYLEAHPIERSKMGEKGRIFVQQRFTRQAAAAQLEKLVVKLVNNERV